MSEATSPHFHTHQLSNGLRRRDRTHRTGHQEGCDAHALSLPFTTKAGFDNSCTGYERKLSCYRKGLS